MPVSMTMHGAGANPVHQSPAKRAAVDEARLRARVDRASKVPGPGSYEVKRPTRSSTQLAGSAAFRTKSSRGLDVVKHANIQGDPGNYESFEGYQLSAGASKTFNKSQQKGSGNFGTAVPRPVISYPAARQHHEVPGPGTYDGKLPERPEAKQGSSFASQTKRGMYISKGQTETPGAGEYDPNGLNTGGTKIQGGDSMFKNKDTRFDKHFTRDGKLQYTTPPQVGPGSYAQDNLTIEQTYQKNTGKVSMEFQSTVMRDAFLGVSESL